MKMATTLKEITSKIAKEARESIILVKVVSLNHNLILHPPKYLRYTWQMVQLMLENREMDLDKDQGKPLMLMEVFMMENGLVTKSMVMVNFSMLMKQNTMVNGRMI